MITPDGLKNLFDTIMEEYRRVYAINLDHELNRPVLETRIKDLTRSLEQADSVIRMREATIAQLNSELNKWKNGGRPDDLEMLRKQYEDSPTSHAAAAAYIHGLVCEYATIRAKLGPMEEQ